MRLKDVEPIIRELQDEEQYGADYFLPIELLKAAPTIEAKPVVHAHWIEKWTEESGHELICSNCGEYALMNGEFYSDASEYCPYCGAQMDEVVSDNNVGSKTEGVKIPVISMEDVCRIEKEMEEAVVKTLKIENPFLKEENNED